ncbi:hypothetical protein OH77DRAFT_1075464 [Trametes cingulata]|nr:hypothetical protein OH77DRAFT_1075464 [Trametes cingulata]
MTCETPFMMLDQDCLEEIFKLLRPGHGLRPLSLTSKWMRSRCKRILFERSFGHAHNIYKPDRLPSPSIWPYIRSLVLRGCFDTLAETDMDDPHADIMRRTEDVLSSALPSMPRLSSILLEDSVGSGVPWPILAIMLSAPQLRGFVLRSRLFRRDQPPPSNPSLHLAPLVSFSYTPYDLRPHPRSCSSEKRVLAILLSRLCKSLESLAIPSESAPFRLLNRWDWPRLRELSIEGHASRVLESRDPLVSVLSTMPHLRVLTLKLAYLPKQDLRAIWPQDEDRASLPWPELESLTISWAYPGDRIYDHLPASLRHLCLRNWPRSHSHYVRRLECLRTGVSWIGRMLMASDVLCILQRCRRVALERLDVEYKVDARDLELLRFIPTAFPNLRVLQVHRNRALHDFSPIPVEEITDLASALPHLRVLRLYLDPKHLVQNAYGGEPKVPAIEYMPVIQATISAVTRKAGPSLEYLCLLIWIGPSARWNVYRLERDADGRVEARYDRDETIDKVAGYDNNNDD